MIEEGLLFICPERGHDSDCRIDGIGAIGQAADLNLEVQEHALIDDLSHCVVLPPLVDCCVALTLSPSVDRRFRSSQEKGDRAAQRVLMERHVSYCLAHGIRGVAVSDDITDLLEDQQENTEQGSMIEIRTAGHPCGDGQGCRQTDFLRINYSASIDDEKAPSTRLTHEELVHIIRHRGDRKAVVVANGAQQVKEAIEAGCDAIEQGYEMGMTNFSKMVEKNILWIPSVLRAKNGLDGAASGGSICCRFSQRYVAPGKPVPGAEVCWKKSLADQLSQLRSARKLGVTTASGTGAGSIGILHGESMVEEMKLFIKAGYTLEETIRCASENGARFFNMEQLG